MTNSLIHPTAIQVNGERGETFDDQHFDITKPDQNEDIYFEPSIDKDMAFPSIDIVNNPLEELDKVPLGSVCPWLNVDDAESCMNEVNLENIELYLECSEDGENSEFRNVLSSHDNHVIDQEGTSVIKSDLQMKISFPQFQDDMDKGFKCCCCKKKFKLECSLRDHVNLEHINQAFVCQLCMYNTKSRKFFQNHMNTKHKKLFTNNEQALLYESQNQFSNESFRVYVLTGENATTTELRGKCPGDLSTGITLCEQNTCSTQLPPIQTVQFREETFPLQLPITQAVQSIDELTSPCTVYVKNNTDNISMPVLKGVNSSNINPSVKSSVSKENINTRASPDMIVMEPSLKVSGEEKSSSIKFTCDVCGFVTKSHKLLKSHCSTIHNSHRQKFTCSVCNFECLQKRTFDKHHQLHIGVYHFNCTDCGKRFLSKSSYSRHLKTHRIDRKYTCGYTQCGKTFKTKGAVTDHQKKVHGLGNMKRNRHIIHKDGLERESSNKSISHTSKAQLLNKPSGQIHLDIFDHIESETFSENTVNSNVVDINTETPVTDKEEVVTKTTQTEIVLPNDEQHEELSNHMSKQTWRKHKILKINNFSCPHEGCLKSFRDNHNLKNHMCTHYGTKRLQCDLCSFICIQKASLSHHYKTKHLRQ